MKRALMLAYGVACYALFFATVPRVLHSPEHFSTGC